MGYTNQANLPISIAAWLAHDGYNHDPDVISVTNFIKPVRELILANKIAAVPNLKVVPKDILSNFKAKIGTAIHASIEDVWLNHKDNALQGLDIPFKVTNRMLVNPDMAKLNVQSIIPVYTELTLFKEHDGFMFRGTADMIFNGRLQDYKSTSTYAFSSTGKDYKYMLQGSMYRWIDSKVITDPQMDIIEIYLDWSQMRATVDKDGSYPQYPIITKSYDLMSIPQTEKYVVDKLKMIDELQNAPQDLLPLCTDDELWRKPPVFKFYKTPGSKRSTKNFTDPTLAYAMLREVGQGIVVEEKSKVTACKYCEAFPICDQAQALINKGELEI